ncbi:uncharacterized protein [Antedon mediterranea]|uniref:uncharacterized protein n=1 Tax=Antedon mediterranea TaxID=105859 RepID=UPI003AF6B533
MERLTYMFVLFLSCCFCFFACIQPTNSTQYGLGLSLRQQLGLSHIGAEENGRANRDVYKRDNDDAPVVPMKTTHPTPSTEPKPTTKQNNTNSDENNKESNQGFTASGIINGITSQGTLKRMVAVLLSITVIALLYFVYRTIRLRRNRKTRKYGVLTTNSDHLEMAPLDQEEDDEDMTVFEANSRYK